MLNSILIIFAILLTGCSDVDNSKIIHAVNTQKDTSFEVRELTISKDAEQGWGADIRLSFIETVSTDSATIYEVRSTFRNKQIGFELSIPKHGFSKMAINSSGNCSDNFIQTLSNLYKQRIDTGLKFTNHISADCVNIGDYIDSLNKQPNSNYISRKAQYKLFFQGKNDSGYAELYLNVSNTDHWIELEEKDIAYRPVLINLFTQK